MVQELQIGRIGLDVDLIDPEVYSGSGAPAGQKISLSGTALGTTLAESKVLRDELVALAAMPGIIVPITWTGDTSIDAFYRLVSASFDVQALHDRGFIRFTVNADRAGSEGDLMFRSKLVGLALANDHGITDAESAPFHAPPRGGYGYNPGSSVPSFVTRTGSDGAIQVYEDVDFDVDPWWSVSAANFYAGGAQIEFGSTLFTRSGVTTENLPDDWRISNELIRVSPNGSAGRLDVAHHDGTQWETAKVWRIQSGGADVGQWNAVRILRNTPEECSVRLTRDVSAGGELTLDLSVRRGSRFVTGYLSRHAAATLKVVLATAEAGATVTPSGASSAVGIDRTSNDGDGNRYIVGSARSFVNDLTNGGLSKASTTTLDFFIGSEIDGSSAAAGDTSADLCLQYLGNLAEHVITAPR